MASETATPSGGMSPGDVLALALVGPAVAVALVGAVARKLRAWLVDHRVLLPGDQAAVRLPGFDGAGLDPARLAVALVVVLALTAWAAWAAVKIAARRRHRIGETGRR